MAQPLAAPRNSQPINDAVHNTQMQIPKSTCGFNTFPVQQPANFQNSDGVTIHNKGYSLRPPHHVPSNQFSFVHGEHHVRPQREVPPPPSYSNSHHFVQNMERENFYNNQERSRPPPYDYSERWNVPAPYSGNILMTDGASVCFGCAYSYVDNYLSCRFCSQVLGIVIKEVCQSLMVVIHVNQLDYQVMGGDFLPSQ